MWIGIGKVGVMEAEGERGKSIKDRGKGRFNIIVLRFQGVQVKLSEKILSTRVKKQRFWQPQTPTFLQQSKISYYFNK